MALTSVSTIVAPELWAEAVQGALGSNAVGVYDQLWSAGGVVSNPNLLESEIGKTVNVPYDTILPDYEQVNTDGTAGTVVGVSRFNEAATVTHWTVNYQGTGWAHNLPGNGNLLARVSDQFGKKLKKQMVNMALDSAVASGLGGQSYSVYSTGSAVNLSHSLIHYGMYDLLKVSSIDEIACICVTGKSFSDLETAGNSPGVAYWQAQTNKFFPPIVQLNDSHTVVPVSMSAVAGSDAKVSLSGTPTTDVNLKVVVTTTGDQTHCKLNVSTDGGINYINLTGAASIDVNDSAAYVHAGQATDTGINLLLTTGTYTAGEYWTATTTKKNQTIIIKKGALLAHYNLDKANPVYFYDSERDVEKLTSHLYGYAVRYLRCGELFQPGIALIQHN